MLDSAMVVGPDWLGKQLEKASPDLREMVTSFITTLMGAEVDAVCGAEYGVVTGERVNSRNGYRHRYLDTRPGTFLWRRCRAARLIAEHVALRDVLCAAPSV